MKNSLELENHIDVKYNKILSNDKIEIDNPDKYHPRRLLYIDRIITIIEKIKKKFPIPDDIKIGEFGCAQGNMSLILAEIGYKVFAIDISTSFLEYSKLKYEMGDIQWINDNIDDLKIPENILDVAILGEIIEHCAYPEDIIYKILKYVRPGGFLIITTPNGSRIKTGIATFSQFSKEQRIKLVAKQFGPDGEHHLFLFRLDEVESILPKNVKIIEKGYLGSTILINNYSSRVLKIIPIRWIEYSIKKFSKIPIINKKTFNNIYFVVKKL